MKPSELIKLARECADYYGHDSEGGITIPFPRDKLLELADKFEMAYSDLQLIKACVSCKSWTPLMKAKDIARCAVCSETMSKWQWRGDV